MYGYLRIGQPQGSLGLPDIERNGGWVSSHRPAKRIFSASRYREKQGDGYLRIGQPQGTLGLPNIERSGLWVSSHRPATRIFRASLYKVKLGMGIFA